MRSWKVKPAQLIGPMVHLIHRQIQISSPNDDAIAGVDSHSASPIAGYTDHGRLNVTPDSFSDGGTAL